MGAESWSLTAKPCDSCKTAAAIVFCLVDSAFLCPTCDGEIHAANNLASRHPRVRVCEVCEQSPAVVTCKADAAALCAACDAEIHSANPLARRHERLPVVPFYDAVPSVKPPRPTEEFSEMEVGVEAEAASWILPDPNSKLDVDSGSTEQKSPEYLFTEMDPHLDLHLIPGPQKPGQFTTDEHKQDSSDGVVPVEDSNECGSGQYPAPAPAVDGCLTYNLEYTAGSKPFMYNFTSQSFTQSVSSSSFEAGVVPDHNAMGDISKNVVLPCRALGIDREARVSRYREKRKNRKFNKTIRYASRKAYAEKRPRVKGRFAKRTEIRAPSSYSVVPTY
ncbi:hypothetical protein ACS0TY_022407 [Phlomoides rotata]